MIDFKSNDEITDEDLDQIYHYAISLYEEITNGGYEDVDKTAIKNRIRHLVEIVERRNLSWKEILEK